jgi:hypothetical protein
MVNIILFILVVHWLADFVLQTDWQATNKSTRADALLLHVGTYTLAMLVAALIAIRPLDEAVTWAVLNGVLHLATDFVTSRLSASAFKRGDRHTFFVVIGFDQLIHQATLIGTLAMVQFG